MTINILEDITTDLAARVLTQVGANTDKDISVNIMSRGGDMMAGNAIIQALTLSPAKVTTNVYGVAASMAAAISQVGDKRLIAEDAIFQPHNGAGLNGKRPTKENLRNIADQLDVMDSIMIKSFSKSNLKDEALLNLLIEDKPLTAKEATDMAFFDGSIEKVEALAIINNINMENDNNLMAKLKAIKDKFIPTAVEDKPEDVMVDTPVVEAPATDGEPEVMQDNVSRAEFEKLMKLVEDLIAKISPLDAPTVSEQVTARVEEMFKAIVTDDVAPMASTVGIDEVVQEKAKVSFIEARQKEITSKFNKK